jgi:hypothetical protein
MLTCMPWTTSAKASEAIARIVRKSDFPQNLLSSNAAGGSTSPPSAAGTRRVRVVTKKKQYF